MEAVPLENTEETEETNQEQIEHMSEEDIVLPAPKKRGRPKGSLGKKKIAQEKAHVLDVSFDSEEILPREDKPVEMEPPTA